MIITILLLPILSQKNFSLWENNQDFYKIATKKTVKQLNQINYRNFKRRIYYHGKLHKSRIKGHATTTTLSSYDR